MTNTLAYSYNYHTSAQQIIVYITTQRSCQRLSQFLLSHKLNFCSCKTSGNSTLVEHMPHHPKVICLRHQPPLVSEEMKQLKANVVICKAKIKENMLSQNSILNFEQNIIKHFVRYVRLPG